jgi:hypothetical protein
MELRDVDQDDSMLDELEINKYLVFKKPEEDGPDIRGGHPDALLIHATKANKHGTQNSTIFDDLLIIGTLSGSIFFLDIFLFSFFFFLFFPP